MTDVFTREKRSEVMSRIRGRDTKMEVSFRKALWRAGLRGWRKHWGPHRIDVAFVGRRVAIFLDGCFWHGCPRHYREPKSNRRYWIPKIGANVERDGRTTEALQKEGWTVVRIWEHDLERGEPTVAHVEEIRAIVRREE